MADGEWNLPYVPEAQKKIDALTAQRDELLAMLRRLDESSMLLPATLSADLENLIDRYKDVNTGEV